MARTDALRFAWLRGAVVALLIRPALLLLFGLGVRHRERLPTSGPAIVIANHNSHLDTLLLLSLFPLRSLKLVRPVAAADYFGGRGALSWVVREIIGGLLIDRHSQGRRTDPLEPPSAALERGEIVLIFPEGTRGQPEVRERLKSGLAHLGRRHPTVPIIPVALRGLGRALPKGEWLPVPLNLYAAVGEPVAWQPDRQTFLDSVEAALDALESELPGDQWD
ncbi:lysophospholipid acyltransferase family protein [Deinococcus sp.]|uniref:lysophospholipid acyltransferase family protein n=1 Tax=Deinococcus sp. TaxID=47478 RepID=UPI003CC5B24F